MLTSLRTGISSSAGETITLKKTDAEALVAAHAHWQCEGGTQDAWGWGSGWPGTCRCGGGSCGGNPAGEGSEVDEEQGGPTNQFKP